MVNALAYLCLSLFACTFAANTKFVAILTRHGARAPTKIYEFDKAYWKADELG
jgi:hypothetical protein